MEGKKVSFGLRLNCRKGKAVENSENLPSPCTTPVSKKSSSLYKEVLKESINGKSRVNSPRHTRQATSTRDNEANLDDGLNFHCSFDSDDDKNTSDVSLPLSQPVTEKQVLQGVVAYIEVRTNTENRFDGISRQMELLGAVVVKKFIPEVTHVVFKDGKKSTRDKATKKGIHLVNVLWVESCRQTGKRESEDLFPVTVSEEMHTPIAKLTSKRTKSMQPRSFEEDLRHSTERVNRRRRRKEVAEKSSPLSSRIPYQQSGTPCNPLLLTPCLSPAVYFTATPVLYSTKHHLGNAGISGEMMNRLKSVIQSKASPSTHVDVETPTTPKAAPLDVLQTASGPGKKRKRNKARDECPTKSPKQATKKVKTTIKTVDTLTYSEEDDIKIHTRKNTLNEDDKVEDQLSLPSEHTDHVTLSEYDEVNTNNNCIKPNKKSKGSKKETQVGPTSKEYDVFAYTEEEVPERKILSREKKPSRSKSLSKRKSSLSTNEAKDQQTGLKPKALPKRTAEQQENGRLFPVEQDVEKQDERNLAQEKILSDSGIYLSEVEVNDCKTSTNSNKRKSIRNKCGTTVGKVLDKQSDDAAKTIVNRKTNSESHSLNSQGKTERTETSPDTKNKKGIKKNRKRIVGSDEEETTSEEDKKTSLQRKGRKTEAKTGKSSVKKTKQGTKRHRNTKLSSDEDGQEPTTSEEDEVETSANRKEHVNDQQTDDGDGDDDDDDGGDGDDNDDGGDDDDDDGSDDHNEVREKSINTTDEFQENKLKARKKATKVKKPSRSLVLTSMHCNEQDIVVSVVRKLGGFYVTDNVSTNTTHIVSGVPKRTLNVLLAIAQGCWLVSPEWVMKSLEAGYWIDEEPYELSDAFPSAQLSRLERVNVGPDYQQDLFTEVEPIYVCDNTSPPRDALVQLITLCGGQVCTSIRKAGICVGNVNRKSHATKVSETWVIDSITEHAAMPFSSYLLS